MKYVLVAHLLRVASIFIQHDAISRSRHQLIKNEFNVLKKKSPPNYTSPKILEYICLKMLDLALLRSMIYRKLNSSIRCLPWFLSLM